MNSIQTEVDERTRLAGNNKFELLLFRLGAGNMGESSEVFGINVFKVRELLEMPKITAVAGGHQHILGVISLRGQIIPVIDVAGMLGLSIGTCNEGRNILLVTEYARSMQAFAVKSVEDIVRLQWDQVMAAEASNANGMITGIARMEDEKGDCRLIQVLDVEQILALIQPLAAAVEHRTVSKLMLPAGTVILAADDSATARAMICKGLEAMGAPFIMTKTGKEAWEKLEAIAAQVALEGKTIHDRICLVLTDLEMPEMDGFTLTRNIKQSPRFRDIPVIVHSSLTGTANEEHAKNVGANAYVAKFSAEDLAATIRKVMA